MMVVPSEEGNDVEIQNRRLCDDDGDGGEAQESVVEDLLVTQDTRLTLGLNHFRGLSLN